MLARIESGEFPEGTILLVESIDRIGRLEHLETEALMNRILGNGLEIHTLQDGLIYTKDALADDFRNLNHPACQSLHSASGI
ncbi:recombinase [Escherichia coli]|uniref:Recombinase n=1 Tax=Escherichia coli TaxID=562 RepID=A0A2X1IVX9_ECOLX|nr:recombinase [Escherichia coli]